MKYNPKINEHVASLNQFSGIHPNKSDKYCQPAIRIVYELEQMLKKITGMSAFTLQPSAGSQGEFVGLLLMRKYHEINDNLNKNIKSSLVNFLNSTELKLSNLKLKEDEFNSEYNRVPENEKTLRSIERELETQKFKCDFKSRPKSVYSIWNKMKKQKVTFDEVYDILAVRIISDSKASKEKEDCWKIYSIVSDIYPPNPKRLRDWISTPKASGYESLHTTVQAPNKKWVEVQIRTKRMDVEAEEGQAAHWRYKGFGSKKDSESWLGQVRDILEHPEQLNFDEAINQNKKKKETDKIFIFTPNGDLKQLPAGSTVLDFAYEIHTDVGSKCNGAKVNNKVVPIRYILENGDKVEIMTSKNQKPKLDWLSFVITNKAKNRIKRFMLEDKYKEADAGNEIVRRKFKNWKIAFDDANIDKIIKHYKFKTSIDFYYSVATESIDLGDVKKFILGLDEKKVQKNGNQVVESEQKATKQDNEESLEITDKIKNVNYSLAKCCNPIPGDEVFAYIFSPFGLLFALTSPA